MTTPHHAPISRRGSLFQNKRPHQPQHTESTSNSTTGIPPVDHHQGQGGAGTQRTSERASTATKQSPKPSLRRRRGRQYQSLMCEGEDESKKAPPPAPVATANLKAREVRPKTKPSQLSLLSRYAKSKFQQLVGGRRRRQQQQQQQQEGKEATTTQKQSKEPPATTAGKFTAAATSTIKTGTANRKGITSSFGRTKVEQEVNTRNKSSFEVGSFRRGIHSSERSLGSSGSQGLAETVQDALVHLTSTYGPAINDAMHSDPHRPEQISIQTNRHPMQALWQLEAVEQNQRVMQEELGLLDQYFEQRQEIERQQQLQKQQKQASLSRKEKQVPPPPLVHEGPTRRRTSDALQGLIANLEAQKESRRIQQQLQQQPSHHSLVLSPVVLQSCYDADASDDGDDSEGDEKNVGHDNVVKPTTHYDDIDDDVASHSSSSSSSSTSTSTSTEVSHYKTSDDDDSSSSDEEEYEDYVGWTAEDEKLMRRLQMEMGITIEVSVDDDENEDASSDISTSDNEDGGDDTEITADGAGDMGGVTKKAVKGQAAPKRTTIPGKTKTEHATIIEGNLDDFDPVAASSRSPPQEETLSASASTTTVTRTRSNPDTLLPPPPSQLEARTDGNGVKGAMKDPPSNGGMNVSANTSDEDPQAEEKHVAVTVHTNGREDSAKKPHPHPEEILRQPESASAMSSSSKGASQEPEERDSVNDLKKGEPPQQKDTSLSSNIQDLLKTIAAHHAREINDALTSDKQEHNPQSANLFARDNDVVRHQKLAIVVDHSMNAIQNDMEIVDRNRKAGASLKLLAEDFGCGEETEGDEDESFSDSEFEESDDSNEEEDDGREGVPEESSTNRGSSSSSDSSSSYDSGSSSNSDSDDDDDDDDDEEWNSEDEVLMGELEKEMGIDVGKIPPSPSLSDSQTSLFTEFHASRSVASNRSSFARQSQISDEEFFSACDESTVGKRSIRAAVGMASLTLSELGGGNAENLRSTASTMDGARDDEPVPEKSAGETPKGMDSQSSDSSSISESSSSSDSDSNSEEWSMDSSSLGDQTTREILEILSVGSCGSRRFSSTSAPLSPPATKARAEGLPSSKPFSSSASSRSVATVAMTEASYDTAMSPTRSTSSSTIAGTQPSEVLCVEIPVPGSDIVFDVKLEKSKMSPGNKNRTDRHNATASASAASSSAADDEKKRSGVAFPRKMSLVSVLKKKYRNGAPLLISKTKPAA